MKFKYKRVAPGILRPIIPVELRYGKKRTRYEVLVDSGADMCFFDAQIGYPLGINITQGKKGELGGITGAKEIFYRHNVRLVIGGHEHQIEAGFMPHMPAYGYGVVGQVGFFDRFVVKFDYRKAVVDLRPKP